MTQLFIQTQQANSNILHVNLILNADSYKFSHPELIKKTGIKGMQAYIEPRERDGETVSVGLYMWIKKNLMTPITTADVDEAEQFLAEHGEPFDRSDWDRIVNEFGGYLPITIDAVPEGTVFPSSNIQASITSVEPGLAWLASFIETNIQRGIWYPSTIASEDRKRWKLLMKYYEASGADTNGVAFALHDFGGRGVTCEEQAQIGGMAHLVYFMGSDTISGIRAANFYYDERMSGYSVRATEHTIQIQYGPSIEGQLKYLEDTIDTWAKPGVIFSVVIDGYDTMREALAICVKFKDKLIASGSKLVFRPDSGDPVVLIPALLKLQAEYFGYETNAKGYKKPKYVGLLWGDGIDTLLMEQILLLLTNHGWASDCIVFGSGGALLQKVNRDTKKYAQKSCASLGEDDVWRVTFKDPITDQGKRSKAGVLKLFRNLLTGDYATMDTVVEPDPRINAPTSWEPATVSFYSYGTLHYNTQMSKVRNTAQILDYRDWRFNDLPS